MISAPGELLAHTAASRSLSPRLRSGPACTEQLVPAARVAGRESLPASSTVESCKGSNRKKARRPSCAQLHFFCGRNWHVACPQAARAL
eukprot:12502176-Heterocapsa_arctica.AAC.1